MHGYNLIQKYGGVGCHEIKGVDGPNRRVRPDLRLEPNYFAAAQQWKHAPQAGFGKLTAEEQSSSTVSLGKPIEGATSTTFW